ncbi:MAG TPA: DUF5673 domain-containing protein [Clostridium sp.]
MNFTLALPLICIFAADILFFTTIQNNKLDFKGKNQYRFVTPVVVIVYIISLFTEKNFTFENILIVVGLVIFAFLGNKCGVGKKGIITGSWFTAWSKIDEVSVENQGEKCILLYSNKNIRKRLIFEIEEENELKKYIKNIKRENNI